MPSEPKHVAAFKTKSYGATDSAILRSDSVDCVVFSVFSVFAAVKIDGVQLQRNASGQTRGLQKSTKHDGHADASHPPAPFGFERDYWFVWA